MNGIISTAYAQTGAAPSSGSGLSQIMILVVFVVIFYFMLIRPQQKRLKETQAMLSKLAAGDEVVTTGGVLGRIVEVADTYLTLEIADNVRIKVQKAAVSQLLPKGTLKNG